MIRFILSVLALALATCLFGGNVAAQNGSAAEDHYTVYEDVPFPTYLFRGVILLEDQFAMPIQVTDPTLAYVGYATEKNGEPVRDLDLRHLWWDVGPQSPQDERSLEIFNQFGQQNLIVKDPRYLLNPGSCFVIAYDAYNHYLCYEAVGPPVNVPVTLVESGQCQNNVATSIVMEPVYFCNPVVKSVEGRPTTKIVDPETHLTVYRIEPFFSDTADDSNYDQFYTTSLVYLRSEALLLEVPTTKVTPVSTEESSWGMIKSLYYH